ncbi:MAG: hypothetical protein L6V81_04010 [Clostridium sp.]|nr:MAG: hypothetical protein L6V81_04010 [Clostridium sp.]
MIDFNMEKILEKCYNGTTKDKLFLYLSMIIADKDEREKIIKKMVVIKKYERFLVKYLAI